MAEHAHACAEPMNGVVDGDPDVSQAEEDSITLDADEAVSGGVDEPTDEAGVEDIAHAGRDKHLMRLTSLTAAGIAFVVVLGCLIGWLGYLRYQTVQVQAQRNEFIEAARQGALNLTTIDYATVEDDVQRILDSSIGALHEDFEQRSQPFIDVVKKVRSSSQGTVTAAGLESQEGDQAQVLVAVLVTTSTTAGPESQPRGWRMRIGVQKVGDFAKVSNVQFVP